MLFILLIVEQRSFYSLTGWGHHSDICLYYQQMLINTLHQPLLICAPVNPHLFKSLECIQTGYVIIDGSLLHQSQVNPYSWAMCTKFLNIAPHIVSSCSSNSITDYKLQAWNAGSYKCQQGSLYLWQLLLSLQLVT